MGSPSGRGWRVVLSYSQVLKFSPRIKIQVVPPGADLYLNKLAPSVGPKIFYSKETDGRSGCGMRAGRNKGEPIRLDFELEDTEVHDHNITKGNGVMDEDVGKPFKEARKTPLTRRIIDFAGPKYKMPTNIKLYDGTTDPEDHLSRFASAANSGEWPMPVWCRMFQQTLDGSARGWEPHEIIKIIRKDNESLMAFKERWTVETGFIMGVSEVLKISSFMDSVKSPELANRFSDQVPATVNEMMERLDDFVRSEVVICKHRASERENGRGPHKASLTFNRRDNRLFRNTHSGESRRNDYRSNYKERDLYLTSRARDDRALYPPPRGEYNHRVALVLTLGSLTKHPKEILATKTQLRLPVPRPMLNPLRSGNTDRYCDYHQEKEGKGIPLQGCSPTDKDNKCDKCELCERQKLEVRETTESWMNIPISFLTISSEDIFEEPLIVEAEVEGYSVRRVYVDEGSSVEVMFEHCFEKLNSRIKARLKETQTDLVGFAGEISKPLGKIELETHTENPSSHTFYYSLNDEITLRAIPSTIHSMMKLPTPKGVATLVTRTVIIAECRQLEKKQMIEEEVFDGAKEVAATKEVLVNPSFPDQQVTIGGRLSKICKDQLRCLLEDNIGVFAWEPTNMTGVPHQVIEHMLNVNLSLDPVCQKRRTSATEKNRVVTKEVAEWVKTCIVCLVRYPTYIFNPVLVKKGDGTWRMCIDFKNLNLAYPKDYYPLLNIDCKGTYCYTKISFALKNAGATYQRLVDLTFQSQIRRNLEAYVDDMVIKSRDEKMLLADIAKTFDNLKKINMKLNPKKCSFRVEDGKFLGYMVTSEGIRTNPKKPRLWQISNPTNVERDAKLERKAGCSQLESFLTNEEAHYGPPFVNSALGKRNPIRILGNIGQGRERGPFNRQEGKAMSRLVRKPTLNEAERNYAPMEKLTLSLIHMTRRLRRYFEVHLVKFITDQPIKNILKNTETSRKLAKYAVELGAYNIMFMPRNAVKGQALADFLSEAPEGEKEELYFRTPEVPLEKYDTERPNDMEHTYALRLTFLSTNNEVAYEALLTGLRIAHQMNISHIKVKVDSKLVANQINGSYKANKDSMIKYLAKAKEHASRFKSFLIENIPRSMNQKVDILSKLASVAFNHLTKEVLVEVLNERSTEGQEVHTIVEEEGDNWMNPIRWCLEEGIWPGDKNKARCLRAKIGQYAIESRVLFNKGYLVPMLRCVGPLEANYVIREIHIGSCGMHVGPCVVVRKAVRQGYYWPTMHEDAKKEVQKYDLCQIHASVPRLPKTLMMSIMAPWPFYRWGMDILGPLPPARGGAKFVIVPVDYFTKWIESKPLVRIMGKEVIRFVMDNVICRFGLPRIIVTDNGAQLVSDPFKSWCERFEIHQMITAVAHPQANSLVERANQSLMEGNKTRIGRKKPDGSMSYLMSCGHIEHRSSKAMEKRRLERKETTAIREARYKSKMERYYNKKVRLASFRPGKFVFKRNKASRVEDHGNLGPKWEGPYRVMEAYKW
uniref:Integrase catalytic domain-containing protein n=1 Tax=Tanacetum cinerariifolium TaxID=118510 RepID=A0A6L2JI39_TANCI|nr:hypothetical protein [Tanacetum cinerariifolium]